MSRSPKKRILFIGTRTWELTSVHLQYFVDEEANIVGFIESPTDSITSTTSGGSKSVPINEVADSLDLPILQTSDLKSKMVHEWVKTLSPDIIVVVGYQFFLPKEFLDLAPMGAVNFHTSLLPRHCGKHPAFWTIWYGDKYSGMTIHQMDDGLDTGRILYYNCVEVKNGDTVDSLYKRIWDKDKDLVSDFLCDLDSSESIVCARKRLNLYGCGWDRLNGLDEQDYSYNYTPNEKDYVLDFRYPAQTLANRCSMKPHSFYVEYDGARFYPTKYSVIDEPTTSRNFKLGTPYRYKGSVVFVTPDKWLKIDQVDLYGEPYVGDCWAGKEKEITIRQ